MNEQLQMALVSIIDQSIDGINQSITFLSDQLPDVINQLLIWKALENFLFFSIGIFIIVIGQVLAKKQESKVEKAKEDYKNGEAWTRYSYGSRATSTSYDMLMYSPFLYPFIFTFIGSAIILNSYKWIMILVAPKIYLIEYASSLVK